jgi:hypothetical protein
MRRKPSTIWTEESMRGLRYLLPDSAQARIDGRRGSPDPEYRDVWSSLTPGERIFLMVFWSAFRLRYLDKLVALYRGDIARAQAVQSKLRSDYVIERRGLERVTPAKREQDARDNASKRQSDDVPRRHRGWMRDDVASEALNRDLEPLLGPARYDPIRLPEYEPAPSPVRRVSIEEYEATKQRPKKGGVNLSFLPKVNSGSADKINEGFDDHDYTERPDYRHDIAGYDDPRHEDGPHNPRYSPE